MWSGQRSRHDDHESETTEDSDESDEDSILPHQKGALPHQNNASDADRDSDMDSEYEWKEPGSRNGLEMDDLVDEDFQRIIAQFGVLSLSFSYIKFINRTPQKKSLPRRT